MPVSIKKRMALKDLPKDISKRFSKMLKQDIEVEIINEILEGKSPVRNHKFEKYSESYAKTKGREKPVDMFKTGDMLDSIKVKQNTKGDVIVSFSDKKAKYHQNGEGRLPVRKLLPKGKEKFNTRLTKFINKILRLAVKKTIKKQ